MSSSVPKGFWLMRFRLDKHLFCCFTSNTMFSKWNLDKLGPKSGRKISNHVSLSKRAAKWTRLLVRFLLRSKRTMSFWFVQMQTSISLCGPSFFSQEIILRKTFFETSILKTLKERLGKKHNTYHLMNQNIREIIFFCWKCWRETKLISQQPAQCKCVKNMTCSSVSNTINFLKVWLERF